MATDTVNREKNKEKQLANLRPFKKGDKRINRKGAPKRGQSWSESMKRITDMTREEAIAYVGPNSKIGKQLKELSPDMPIKDAIIFATIIAYGREPNARMLSAIMDREEGRPLQAVDVTSKGEQIGNADDTRSEILSKLARIATATGADKLPEQPDK